MQPQLKYNFNRQLFNHSPLDLIFFKGFFSRCLRFYLTIRLLILSFNPTVEINT